MDGTLVDSGELAVGSALEGLRAYYAARGLEPELPAPEAIRGAVGLPSLEYFASLLPPARRADAALLRTLVTRREEELLERGDGRLMPRALATLDTLRGRGWALAIVSNCGRSYLDANLRHLGLGGTVELALCLDDGPDKTHNVKQALRGLGTAGGAMVGDRAGDVDAGRAAGLVTIGCRYGFGAASELAQADHMIDSLAELPALLERL